jgi:hypothetical protein
MILTQEDIDDAVQKQAEYWNRVTDPLDYWKTSKLSKKNLDAVEQLQSLHGKQDVDWAMQPHHEGYEAFTRWRLNKFVENHVSWVFNVVYKSVLTSERDSGLAMTIAEHTKDGIERAMRNRFP